MEMALLEGKNPKMAIFKIAKDGHFFVVRGYPFVNGAGEEESFFANYRVSPRAETIFQILRMRDDSKIDKALFYCLAVEADLICGTPKKSPSALNIAKLIRYRAEGIYESEEFQNIRPIFADPKIRSLCDIVVLINDKFGLDIQKWIELASQVRIAQLVRQHMFEVTRNREWRRRVAKSEGIDATKGEWFLAMTARIIPDSINRACDVRLYLRQRFPNLNDSLMNFLVENWSARRF
jgi:hypothetical protein